jgi:hypothetical protein
MAERKQTPDILAEIMSGTPIELPESVRVPPKSPPRSKRTANPATPKPAKGHWKYQVASFQHHRGYRLRFIDGVEFENWESAPLLHEYLEQMAKEGWELVAASAGEHLFGLNDKHQLFFKRLAG